MPFAQAVMPDFTNVVSPGTAECRPPTGDFTYYELWIHYQESGADVTVANMKTAIEEITLELENRVQWKMSATELFAINEHHGVTAVNGYLPLFLALPRLMTQVPRGADIRDALAWGTGDISSFKVKAKIASGRTSPSLKLYAFGIETNQALGKILQYLRSTETPDAANTYKRISSFEDQTGRPIVALYMNSSDVTHFEYHVGREPVYEDMPVDLFDNLYDSRLNLQSVSGFKIFDFAWSGMPARDAQSLVIDGVPQINQIFSYKSSATTSIPFVIELLGTRG